MQIAIIGTGYVGLVTGTCLANFGLSVTCVDNDTEKINCLNGGKVPIYEPSLEELVKKNVKEHRLRFSTNMKKTVEESQVIYIAVGTPPNHDGSASLKQVEEVAREIAQHMNGYKVIVNKCTVPVGTARKIKNLITDYLQLSQNSKNHNSDDIQGDYNDSSLFGHSKEYSSSGHCEPPSSCHSEELSSSGHCEERSDEAISNNINPGDLSTYNPCQDSPSHHSEGLSGHCEELSSSGHCEGAQHPKQSQFPYSLKENTSIKHSSMKSGLSYNPFPLKGNSSYNPSPLRGEGRVRVTYPFDIISNPEFLREGSAVYDFTHPDKIVIGYESEKAKQIMQEIYRPLYLLDTPFVFTNLETAEMIKYACNAFLATKITFINEIANLCDRVGADINQIAKAMGMDGRISPKFLHPGPGYGGSCFPKDTRALNAIANGYQYDFKLIKSVIEANIRQRKIVVDKIEKEMRNLNNKKIGILGLAFKQNTDDIRESAAIDIIKLLLEKGTLIQCFDPMAMKNTKKILPNLTYCKDEYETSKDADALIILTEWDQFRNLDFNKIKLLMKRHEYGLYFQPYIFDMKNLYEPEKIKKLDFKYFGIGRR